MFCPNCICATSGSIYKHANTIHHYPILILPLLFCFVFSKTCLNPSPTHRFFFFSGFRLSGRWMSLLHLGDFIEDCEFPALVFGFCFGLSRRRLKPAVTHLPHAYFGFCLCFPFCVDLLTKLAIFFFLRLSRRCLCSTCATSSRTASLPRCPRRSSASWGTLGLPRLPLPDTFDLSTTGTNNYNNY